MHLKARALSRWFLTRRDIFWSLIGIFFYLTYSYKFPGRYRICVGWNVKLARTSENKKTKNKGKNGHSRHFRGGHFEGCLTPFFIIHASHIVPKLLLNCAIAVVLWTCVIIAFFVAYHVIVAKWLFIEHHCLVLFVAPHRHWVCIVFFHKFAWELLWMHHLYDSWWKQFLAILWFVTPVLWTSWIMSPISNVCHCTSRNYKNIIHQKHKNSFYAHHKKIHVFWHTTSFPIVISVYRSHGHATFITVPHTSTNICRYIVFVCM